MSSTIATRSALMELREEQASMREGYTFLDEKCLLLAGATLRELRAYEALGLRFAQAQAQAAEALAAALERHGLAGLQNYPLAIDAPSAAQSTSLINLHLQGSSVMGVALWSARCTVDLPPPRWALARTPEAAACAEAYAQLLTLAAQLAAVGSNLERLQHEYKRTARRARALEGVLLPELATDIESIDTSLEEQEREEAILMRTRAR